MTAPFIISLIGAIALGVAAVFAWAALGRQSRATSAVAGGAASVGVLANAIYVGWALADHGPIETFRQYHEATLLLASLIAAVGVGTRFAPSLRGLDGLLFLLAALVDLLALALSSPATASPGYHGWFISHGLSFAISGACFMVGGMSAVAYLIVHRILRRKQGLTLMGKVPSLEALDRFTRWMLTIGFPIFTYGILTGMCGVAHRKDIEQTAWYLDPTVLLSAAAWLVYAWLCGSLVLRPQIRGRRAAALATWGMGLVAVAYFLMGWVSPIHR
ncbi:MAG TPA: cytochrome c biogenesis protein CcsA [Phycisphaerae bacterium]|nr:cytochrome c biogenesis protein CcsA [Phycisphaerae bacterium]